jgi:uncharacterized protein (TIGR03067 family)
VGRTDEAGPTKELAALQGTWKLVSLEVNGKPRDLPENPPRWVIKGDQVLYGGTALARLTLDGTTTPKCIDLSFRKPQRVYEGVYAVAKDTLTVCVNRRTEGVKERPLDFATKDKPDRRLLVFRRDKAGNGTEGLEGYLGIAILALPDGKWVAITGIAPGSPADKAGLKKDDVIVTLGGVEATDLRAVVGMVRQAKPGRELTLRIGRGGKERDIAARHCPFACSIEAG